MALMNLWCHSLVGTQLSHSQRLILEFLGKAQIGNLAGMVMQQDIGQFKIPVHSVDLMKSLEPI